VKKRDIGRYGRNSEDSSMGLLGSDIEGEWKVVMEGLREIDVGRRKTTNPDVECRVFPLPLVSPNRQPSLRAVTAGNWKRKCKIAKKERESYK